MAQLLLLVPALASLLGASARTDLSGKVFVFPRESATDYVTLTPKLEKPLKSFTLCLRAYSDLSRSHSLFSYNARGKDNEILVYKERVGEYSLHVGGTKVTSKVAEVVPSPTHICVTWESSTGIAEFWVNGKPLVRKGLKQGYSVATQPKIILGQEQDSYGGAFNKNQSFVGEIGDVYMWDSVLSPQQILSVQQGSYLLDPNILDWSALDYEIQGYVVVKPLVWD